MRLVSGLLLLGMLAAGALAAPLVQAWLGQDPFTPDLFNRYRPASAANPLGTDELGRDMLLRLLHGARWSLGAAVLAACEVVARALAEDLTPLGDISAALLPPGATAEADVASREAGVFAGTPCFAEALRQVDGALAVGWRLGDGDTEGQSEP